MIKEEEYLEERCEAIMTCTAVIIFPTRCMFFLLLTYNKENISRRLCLLSLSGEEKGSATPETECVLIQSYRSGFVCTVFDIFGSNKKAEEKQINKLQHALKQSFSLVLELSVGPDTK